DGEGRREERRQWERRIGVHALQGQQGGRVGADPDEGGVADRDLPREAAEQVPAGGEDDGEGDVPDVVQRAALEDPRGGQQEDERGRRDPEETGEGRPGGQAGLRRREDRRAKSPGRPCGNTTRAMTRSVKLRASWKDVGIV